MASSAAVDLAPTLETEAAGEWVSVLRCRVCGEHWAEEFPFGEMHGGGPKCLYAVGLEASRDWIANGAGLPARLRQEAEDRAFFDGLGEERSEPRCAAPACRHGAISLSVLCRVHHFEMIKRKVCPFAG
jgi:hypothetical protein